MTSQTCSGVRPAAHQGLGTEPMTCPPNAFTSGDALITLEPGQSVSTA
jgi:aldose 1-epimerase